MAPAFSVHTPQRLFGFYGIVRRRQEKQNSSNLSTGREDHGSQIRCAFHLQRKALVSGMTGYQIVFERSSHENAASSMC